MTRLPVTTAQMTLYLYAKAQQCRCTLVDVLVEMDAERWQWMTLPDGTRLELDPESGLWMEVAA